MSDAATGAENPDTVDVEPESTGGQSLTQEEHNKVLSSRLARQEKKHARALEAANAAAVAAYLESKGLDEDEVETLLAAREEKPTVEKEVRGLKSQLGKLEKDRDSWKAKAERFQKGAVRSEVMKLASRTLYPDLVADSLERHFMLDDDDKVVLRSADGDPDYDTEPNDFFVKWLADHKGLQPPSGVPGAGSRESTAAPAPGNSQKPGDKQSRLAAIQRIVDSNG